jgi:hypothetical protein
MAKLKTLFAGLSLALASLVTAGAASFNDHSWVSRTGSGTVCTRFTPCADFATAIAITRPGGVISVLDSGEYGGPFIGKSLTIRAEATDGGGTVINTIGAFIAIGAAATDVVTLEGLHFSGSAGIQFNSGGQLHVIRCVITNGNQQGHNIGINFQPNSPSKLSVTDTVITNVGNGTGGGIVVKPRAGGSAQVMLKRVTVNGNAFGVVADGTGSTAGINMTIADSMIANNAQDGIIATTPGGGAPIGVMVKNTQPRTTRSASAHSGPTSPCGSMVRASSATAPASAFRAAEHCNPTATTTSTPTAAMARSPDRWC